MMGNIALAAQKSHLIHLPLLHGRKGSSFSGLVPPVDTDASKSVASMKSGDSSVVIGYQIDEFTSTWSVEHFITQSHTNPGFTGNVS